MIGGSNETLFNNKPDKKSNHNRIITLSYSNCTNSNTNSNSNGSSSNN